MSEEELEAMHEWDCSNSDNLALWLRDLREQSVFFSEPLDLDMAMLAAYPDAYKAIIPKGGGPMMKPEDAAKVVLGEGGPGVDIYKDALAKYKDLMPPYRYHFLTRSKPAAHLQALARLDDEAIKKGIPELYRTLIEHIKTNLTPD